MNTPSPDILDSKGAKIVPGSVVSSIIENFIFNDAQGLVIDTRSDVESPSHPIAVFFDSEVPEYRFDRWLRDPGGLKFSSWEKGRIPTLADYRDCFRMLSFHPHQLWIDEKFTRKNIIKRLFNNRWHSSCELSFELVPNTHACQMKNCVSGQLATCESLVNVWGTVYVVYTCPECHNNTHGICCDDFQLKDPLPGKPQMKEPVHA